ncbi:uncharacterized protein V3H82_003453 isoform 2-T2 [Fundulus diaphanus]
MSLLVLRSLPFDEIVLLSGEEVCNKHEVTALLGSSVLLSCNFLSNDHNLVTWTQRDEEDGQDLNLVHFLPEEHVKFLDPRNGRVKVFPNQVLGGNYSIIIDGLQLSDMGSYHCRQSNECYEVKLSEDKGTLSPTMQLLIYMCAGFAALMLLSLFGYVCWLKCTCLSNKSRPTGAIITVSERIEGPSAPPQEVGGVNGHQIGVDYGLVYENDDQYINPSGNPGGQPGVQQHQDGNQPYHSEIGIYPNLEEFKFERAESQRTKQRFHIDLMNRLRQASFNRHFYANQGEIRKQQAKAAQTERKRAGVGRRKANDSCEYKNPIYNRSMDHLDRL